MGSAGQGGGVVGHSATRVVIADDDVLLREGLALLLDKHGFAVVGQAADGEELLELVRNDEPQAVIVDIRMPPTYSTEGLTAARSIRETFPAIAILVLSAHIEVNHAIELIAGGRKIGYLLKSRVIDVDEFVESLERVCRGGSVVDPGLVQELVAAPRGNDPLKSLSRREHDVIELMAEGCSNAGISTRLWISEGTVEKHVRSILSKLDLPETSADHRRVLAVIKYLKTR